MRYKFILSNLLAFAILIALAVILSKIPFKNMVDHSFYHDYMRDKSTAIIFVISVLFIACGFPRQIVAFVNGYIFGVGWGILLSLLAVLTSCLIVVVILRILRKNIMQHVSFTNKLSDKIKHHINIFNDYLYQHTLIMFFLLRMMPFGSNLAVNIVGGLSNVPLFHFFAGSLLGYIPQTVIFALVGGKVIADASIYNNSLIILSIIIYVVLISGFIYFIQRHQKLKEMINKIS